MSLLPPHFTLVLLPPLLLSCGSGNEREEHEERFPIATGSHAQALCDDCHRGGSEDVVSCTDACHDESGHLEAATTTAHDAVAGFEWRTSRCLDCHPEG